MKIRKENLWIYIGGLIISIILLGLYFIDTDNPWCIMSCSIGASGVGAVILAALIENSNEIYVKKTTDDLRENKLSAVGFELLFVLTSTIDCYYQMQFEVLNEPGSDKCQRITYDELWSELEVQCGKWKSIINGETVFSNMDEKKAKAKDIYYHLSKCYEIFGRELKDKENEFKNYEVAGTFSPEEVQDISMAIRVSKYVLYDEYELNYLFMKQLFDRCTGIKELSYFKDMVFEYKDKKISHTQN